MTSVRHLRFVFAVILIAFAVPGCGPDKKQVNAQAQSETLQVIRAAAASRLRKPPEQIDVKKPLVDQGADGVGVIEIIMDAEDALKINLPEDDPVGDGSTTTVESLADLFDKHRVVK